MFSRSDPYLKRLGILVRAVYHNFEQFDYFDEHREAIRILYSISKDEFYSDTSRVSCISWPSLWNLNNWNGPTYATSSVFSFWYSTLSEITVCWTIPVWFLCMV